MKALKNLLKCATAVVLVAVAMNANALNLNDRNLTVQNPDANTSGKGQTIRSNKPQNDHQTLPDKPFEINEFQKNSDVAIYPVPAKDKLFFKLNNFSASVSADIYNIAGEKISSDIINGNFSDVSLNISDLSDGIYILRVTESGKMINKKFIVKNH